MILPPRIEFHGGPYDGITLLPHIGELESDATLGSGPFAALVTTDHPVCRPTNWHLTSEETICVHGPLGEQEYMWVDDDVWTCIFFWDEEYVEA